MFFRVKFVVKTDRFRSILDPLAGKCFLRPPIIQNIVFFCLKQMVCGTHKSFQASSSRAGPGQHGCMLAKLS